ncbi:hypothetical protein PIB30_008436 [Stylosanthes scabra]|uniref:Uncharacterized protein n=1 Tax=Stylosanthes scabra TaxID=79078 RepID=A0ABU6W3I8_9FABA|nr:hypothetical protein [Stylosanthes scabra]
MKNFNAIHEHGRCMETRMTHDEVGGHKVDVGTVSLTKGLVQMVMNHASFEAQKSANNNTRSLEGNKEDWMQKGDNGLWNRIILPHQRAAHTHLEKRTILNSQIMSEKRYDGVRVSQIAEKETIHNSRTVSEKRDDGVREEALLAKEICERGGISFKAGNKEIILAKLFGNEELSGRKREVRSEKQKQRRNPTNIKGRTLATRLLRAGSKQNSNEITCMEC